MKPAQVAQAAFIALASVGVYSFVRASQADHKLSSCAALCQLRPTYAARERRVPDFTLPNFEGQQVHFADYLGKKPVVLNFWTKTCKPCLEEMPMLQELAQVVAKDGVRVVTICTDDGPDEVRDTLSVVLQGQAPAFEILFDPDTTVVTDKFGTTLFPETWLIDGAGVIRARVDGAKNWSGAIPLEVLEMMSRPGGCDVAFHEGQPSGPQRGLCGDMI
jgi:thiol-disulfide isomerase/thioredoxin